MSQTAANVTDIPPGRALAEVKRAPLIVQDHSILLDTAKFEQMNRVAVLMSQAKLVPGHLQNSPADCFLICNQADRWQMDPFMVAQKTFSIQGHLGYEAQLVAAVINSRARLKGRLMTRYEGRGPDLVCIVTGMFEDETEPREKRSPAFRDIKTKNSPLWQVDPEQQLGYWTQRAWARLHAPDVILGVYTQDELETIEFERRGDGSYGPVEPPPARPTRAQFADRGAVETVGTGGTTGTGAAEPEDEPNPGYELVDESGQPEMTAPTPDDWAKELIAAGSPNKDGGFTPKALAYLRNNSDAAMALSNEFSEETWKKLKPLLDRAGEADDTPTGATKTEPEKPAAEVSKPVVFPMKAGNKPDLARYVAMVNDDVNKAVTVLAIDNILAREKPNLEGHGQKVANGIRMNAEQRKAAMARGAG